MRKRIAFTLAALAGVLGLALAAAAQAPDLALEATLTVAPVAAAVGPVVLDDKSIPLAEAFESVEAAQGRVFRTRKIELPPGATTEMESRAGRPAIVHVVQGLVLERRMGEDRPRELQVSDTVFAGKDVTHAFENRSDRPAVLIVSEVLPPA